MCRVPSARWSECVVLSGCRASDCAALNQPARHVAGRARKLFGGRPPSKGSMLLPRATALGDEQTDHHRPFLAHFCYVPLNNSTAFSCFITPSLLFHPVFYVTPPIIGNQISLHLYNRLFNICEQKIFSPIFKIKL